MFRSTKKHESKSLAKAVVPVSHEKRKTKIEKLRVSYSEYLKRSMIDPDRFYLPAQGVAIIDSKDLKSFNVTFDVDYNLLRSFLAFSMASITDGLSTPNCLTAESYILFSMTMRLFSASRLVQRGSSSLEKVITDFVTAFYAAQFIFRDQQQRFFSFQSRRKFLSPDSDNKQLNVDKPAITNIDKVTKENVALAFDLKLEAVSSVKYNETMRIK